MQIGRLPDNTVAIDNPAVSGRHASVMRVGESYILKDLASTNGTFVNDARITEQFLHDGDVVHVGKHTILFINPSQPDTPKPLPDSAARSSSTLRPSEGCSRSHRLSSQPPGNPNPGRPALPAQNQGADRARWDHG